MATLYITEVSDLALSKIGNLVQAPKMPPVAEQTVAISGSSEQSAAFNSATKFIMVETDSICSLAFGPPTLNSNTGPVAVTTAHRMNANETRFYGVNPGDQLAVIANT